MKKVTEEQRRRAKVFNFGVLYGLSDYGLSQREGISREEAAQFIETYFQKYERVKQWQEQVLAEDKKVLSDNKLLYMLSLRLLDALRDSAAVVVRYRVCLLQYRHFFGGVCHSRQIRLAGDFGWFESTRGKDSW